ncbi:predicted protein [Plenodomus lingam JN3]|uniref:Predicted protein n=1 Tax=Leptosphaeria maculans (strain JN3 / isolate v23.1.3 / race Av1-4-5-6-7-8) TaxID=985895 RepID=E5R580_LEPMJ|nr:predicted protein [Plenodomus lingam JN3]CBX92050.1 predicted protein [Plenodomus lingam JN3]
MSLSTNFWVTMIPVHAWLAHPYIQNVYHIQNVCQKASTSFSLGPK